MGGVCVRQMKFPVAHSTTLVWNGLFEQAMTDGASYFLTCHDDTEHFVKNRGAAVLVKYGAPVSEDGVQPL